MRDYAHEQTLAETPQTKAEAKREADLAASRLLIEAFTSGLPKSRAFDAAARAASLFLTVAAGAGLVAAVYALTS